MDTVNQQIITYSKELRLPAFRRDYKELAMEAARERLDYEDYLVKLMEREYDLRLENRKKAQIRNAQFPSRMYLSDIDRSQLPPAHKRNCRYWRDWIS
jgi:DNA replication protein DnaC